LLLVFLSVLLPCCLAILLGMLACWHAILLSCCLGTHHLATSYTYLPTCLHYLHISPNTYLPTHTSQRTYLPTHTYLHIHIDNLHRDVALRNTPGRPSPLPTHAHTHHGRAQVHIRHTPRTTQIRNTHIHTYPHTHTHTLTYPHTHIPTYTHSELLFYEEASSEEEEYDNNNPNNHPNHQYRRSIRNMHNFVPPNPFKATIRIHRPGGNPGTMTTGTGGGVGTGWCGSGGTGAGADTGTGTGGTGGTGMNSSESECHYSLTSFLEADSPASFPPTPFSRAHVMNRSSDRVVGVMFAARDRLRLEAQSVSRDEYSRMIATEVRMAYALWLMAYGLLLPILLIVF
jgi:hypothetical protein